MLMLYRAAPVVERGGGGEHYYDMIPGQLQLCPSPLDASSCTHSIPSTSTWHEM